jgi:mRNA interferase RelE/StbE
MPNSKRYRIRLLETAAREVRRLPGNVRQRVRHVIAALADNPRPSTTRELRERVGRYRIRLDDWRVIYRVDDDAQSVIVLAVRQKTGPETYDDIE